MTEDFEKRYGPPPWTIMNELLAELCLSYQFVEPPSAESEGTYTATLRDSGTGDKIRTDLLSSGEKVLLTVAATLCQGSHLGGSVQLPDILLLDEPDASLHPSVIRSLVSVCSNVLVGRLGIRVFLATHSPTTVALAPEESLFIMSRNGNPRMRRALNRDEALTALTAGLPTLSVNIEDRRTALVESEYDEAIRHRESGPGSFDLSLLSCTREAGTFRESRPTPRLEPFRVEG